MRCRAPWICAFIAVAATSPFPSSIARGMSACSATVIASVLSSRCAALASIVYASRLETGTPVLGQRVLLDVIGAAVIGGVSLFGGRGKIA